MSALPTPFVSLRPVEDADRRRKGLEQARREMAMVAEIGGRRMAAPPVGN